MLIVHFGEFITHLLGFRPHGELVALVFPLPPVIRIASLAVRLSLSANVSKIDGFIRIII